AGPSGRPTTTAGPTRHRQRSSPSLRGRRSPRAIASRSSGPSPASSRGCSVRTPRGPGPSTCRTGAPSAAHSPRAPVTTRARSAIPRSRAPSTTASTGPRRRPRPPSAGTSKELSSPGCAPPSTSPPTPRAGPLGRSEDAADPDRRTAAPGSPDALPVRELLEQTVVGIVLGTEPALAGPAARSGEGRVLTRPLHHQGDDHDQHGQLSADQR